MRTRLVELLSSTVTESILKDVEKEINKNKDKKLTRPEKEVELNALSEDVIISEKTEKDKTKDLVELECGLSRDEFYDIFADKPEFKTDSSICYIYDKNTKYGYVAPTEECLNKNFIYRGDIELEWCGTLEGVWSQYSETSGKYIKGCVPRFSCYILDNPGVEKYEVYYDSNYPKMAYGLATPKGCMIYKYPNRFHRDMAILELDKLYSQASKIRAREFTKMELKNDEAIIVSDGAYLKNACSCALYCITNDQIMKVASGFLASYETQSVLCAEISGAFDAIKIAVDLHKKTSIKYYYDNTSILNVFKNRKTEYLPEVKGYKDYLMSLKNRGVEVEFIELHPKTGEERQFDNKALTFFHNACDAECREMADIFSKRYDTLAIACNKKGVGLDKVNQAKQNSKPKSNGYKKR